MIDPGGSAARGWRVLLVVVAGLTFFHVLIACARGGRVRHFLWPFGHPFWLIRRLRAGGLYAELRDGLWEFLAALRPWYYFRLGFVGFFGTLAWLVVPAVLISAGGRVPPLGFVGALLLAVVVPFLPFLQVRYAVEGRISALFSRRAVRERFRRAPWAFAFSLMVMLLAAIPLYLLKIEMIPREAAWLPSLVFVLFLAPARLLTGWAYARSGRRDRPSHWFFRILGRFAIIPAAAFYVADRLPRPVHLMGRRRNPLRATRFPPARPVSEHVIPPDALRLGHGITRHALRRSLDRAADPRVTLNGALEMLLTLRQLKSYESNVQRRKSEHATD